MSSVGRLLVSDSRRWQRERQSLGTNMDMQSDELEKSSRRLTFRPLGALPLFVGLSVGQGGGLFSAFDFPFLTRP